MFEYDDDRRAWLIATSVGQEVGEIADDRSATTVDRDGRTVRVRIDAADLVALRAAVNTWCSLVEVAEAGVEIGESW
ncbi:KEOPS complex subunit Pcc1, partial [Halovivax sp.]|uniref:KEOPS complex subunit Pcc1 n=1 Tax=Halovivax sp. TaxID=1935978 RepID=UPI0031B7F18E